MPTTFLPGLETVFGYGISDFRSLFIVHTSTTRLPEGDPFEYVVVVDNHGPFFIFPTVLNTKHQPSANYLLIRSRFYGVDLQINIGTVA